jgi:GABA permease
MTATNLFSVSSFGEFAFWFAGIKVAAIVVTIGLGSPFVLGVWRRDRWVRTAADAALPFGGEVSTFGY